MLIKCLSPGEGTDIKTQAAAREIIPGLESTYTVAAVVELLLAPVVSVWNWEISQEN